MTLQWQHDYDTYTATTRLGALVVTLTSGPGRVEFEVAALGEILHDPSPTLEHAKRRAIGAYRRAVCKRLFASLYPGARRQTWPAAIPSREISDI